MAEEYLDNPEFSGKISEKPAQEYKDKKDVLVQCANQPQTAQENPDSHNDRTKHLREEFLNAILEGNKRQAVSIAKSIVHNQEDIIYFYVDIVQHCMQQIGIMWEKGEISVAKEHLATAIVTYVVSIFYTLKPYYQSARGKALVTAAPNELHQLGAWMVADLLELDGWQIRYLGANTPSQELIDMLVSFKPHLLFISVTMPSNVQHAKEIIEKMKQNSILQNIKTIIGGLAISNSPDIWKDIKADAVGLTAKDAIYLARQWMVQ
ncbi:MAG: cobalamin B12-binding domain-containing protein [Candidatus Brocadiae bacterium]|nr:cobalamin B12-binding domain-containing protein [Candidatus Brocadiia bacterium]